MFPVRQWVAGVWSANISPCLFLGSLVRQILCPLYPRHAARGGPELWVKLHISTGLLSGVPTTYVPTTYNIAPQILAISFKHSEKYGRQLWVPLLAL